MKSGDSRADAEHSGSETAGHVRHSSTLKDNMQPMQAAAVQREGEIPGQQKGSNTGQADLNQPANDAEMAQIDNLHQTQEV